MYIHTYIYPNICIYIIYIIYSIFKSYSGICKKDFEMMSSTVFLQLNF